MYFYTVIENQMDNDGNFGLLSFHFDNEEEAYSKLYTVLAYASVSKIQYHSGHLLRSDGIIIDGRVFDRRLPAVEE